jgi:hypothetical protein
MNEQTFASQPRASNPPNDSHLSIQTFENRMQLLQILLFLDGKCHFQPISPILQRLAYSAARMMGRSLL